MTIKLQNIIFVSLMIGLICGSCSSAQAFFVASRRVDVVVTTGDWQAPNLEVSLIRDGQTQVIHELITQPDFDLDPEESSKTIEIENISLPPYLIFEYRLQSLETALGFDEPTLLVSVNGQIVFQDWLAPYLRENPDQSVDSDWQKVYLPLDQNMAGEENNLIIMFQVNNFGDEQFPTRLAVKNMTSKSMVLRQGDLISLNSESDAQVHVGLIDDQDQMSHISVDQFIHLSTDQLNQIKSIQAWSVDLAGNTSQQVVLPITIDTTPPDSITDLQIEYLSQPETIISWTTPSDVDTNLVNYEFELFNLAQPEVNIFDQFESRRLPYGIWAPKPAGVKDYLVFKNLPLTVHQLDIRAIDIGHNQTTTSLNIGQID
ncbi:hypothetical protein KKF92_00775 [Patescibacteria group bacterium]|nr:hypothetical protein [Patescibacteria group bacterium]